MFRLFRPRFKGLKLTKEIGNEKFFQIDRETTIEDIQNFINSVPSKYSITFFDKFHPTISDPGAYCTIQRLSTDVYAYFLANHGWSTGWKSADLDFLTNYLYKNREYNYDTLRIYQWTKRAEIGKRLGEY
jgi:hypothetical protein